MRISDWSSDVCSSDLLRASRRNVRQPETRKTGRASIPSPVRQDRCSWAESHFDIEIRITDYPNDRPNGKGSVTGIKGNTLTLSRYCWRSEEHTSELQSLMRNSYAFFCLQTHIYRHK